MTTRGPERWSLRRAPRRDRGRSRWCRWCPRRSWIATLGQSVSAIQSSTMCWVRQTFSLVSPTGTPSAWLCCCESDSKVLRPSRSTTGTGCAGELQACYCASLVRLSESSNKHWCRGSACDSGAILGSGLHRSAHLEASNPQSAPSLRYFCFRDRGESVTGNGESMSLPAPLGGVPCSLNAGQRSTPREGAFPCPAQRKGTQGDRNGVRASPRQSRRISGNGCARLGCTTSKTLTSTQPRS